MDSNCKLVYFIPGEKTIITTPIAQGILILTNYRIVISTVQSKTTCSIPICLLLRIDLVEQLHIKISTKLSNFVMLSFANELICETVFTRITSIIDTNKSNNGSNFAFEFYSALTTSIPDHPFLSSNFCHLILNV